MIDDMRKLDSLVLKQSIRDLSSKDNTKSSKALLYLKSQDFSNLCKRLSIDSVGIIKSAKTLLDYPMVSRKKIANTMAKEIDKSLLSK